jgi:hypothetical protein
MMNKCPLCGHKIERLYNQTTNGYYYTCAGCNASICFPGSGKLHTLHLIAQRPSWMMDLLTKLVQSGNSIDAHDENCNCVLCGASLRHELDCPFEIALAHRDGQ